MSLITYELDPTSPPSELSTEYSPGASGAGDLISEDSPIQPQPRPGYNNTHLGPSEVSSETTSPDGNIMSPDISPRSSLPEGIPPAARCRNSMNRFKSIARRFAGFYGEAGSSSSGIENQRSASLYANFPANHGIGPLIDLDAETSVGSLDIPLPPMPHPSRPELTLETPATILDFTARASDYETPLYRNQTVNYCAATEIQPAASLRTSLAHSQINEVSVLDTLPLGEDIFMAQSFQDSSINPSPSASHYSISNAEQTSPSSSPTEQELKCAECDFRPKGKPEARKSYLLKHMNSKHKKRSTTLCSVCNRPFTRSDNMLAHCRKRHGAPSGSKRGRGSSDSLPSTVQPKRRSTMRG